MDMSDAYLMTPPKKFITEESNAYVLKIAKEELGETDEVRTNALKEIKRLIKETPDFYPCTDDKFLLRFLRARKFNVGYAHKLLQNYYKYKARHSGIITDFTPSAIKDILELGCTLALDNRDQNGVGIAIVRLGNYDLDKISLDEVVAETLICVETAISIEANIICGMSAIMDCSGLSYRMLTRFARPSFVYNIISAIQDCLPCRVKSIHFINEPSYITLLLRITWIFLSKKLKERIHLHGSNLNSLHKHVPQDILPKELGGKQESYSDLRDKAVILVLNMEDHFKILNKYGYRGKTLENLRRK